MELIIKKAIEGGYFGLTQWDLDNKNYDQNCLYSVVCDPRFWEALGKACGWFEQTLEGQKPTAWDWKHNALRFHEINLTEGWDKAVAYLLAQVPTRGTALVN